MTEPLVRAIRHGGQTGVDRGGADAGYALGLRVEGFAPGGFISEDGQIPAKYATDLEDSGRSYAGRTESNVVKSDGILILHHGDLTGGSRQTAFKAVQFGRPVIAIDLAIRSEAFAAGLIRGWLHRGRLKVLMVAGPRASKWPAGQRVACEVLYNALR